jgi:hypothetical protein
MVRELGVEAAEARPEESAQAPTTKTAAASIGVIFFIPEFLIFEHGIGRDLACRNSSPGDCMSSSPSPSKISNYPERP